MNVQIDIDGRDKVDFSLVPFGWVRNPKIEFCGVDDDDLCMQQVKQYYGALAVEPWENVVSEHLDAARADLAEAFDTFLKRGEAVSLTNVISVTIRPVPKSSRDSTPEEIATFLETFAKQGA